MAGFMDKSMNYSLNQTLKTFELKNNSLWLKILLKWIDQPKTKITIKLQLRNHFYRQI